MTTVSTTAHPATISPFFSGRRERVKLYPASNRKLQQMYCCHTWHPGAVISYQDEVCPNTYTQSNMAW